MNFSIILYILGWVLNFEAFFLLLPSSVSLIYKEKEGLAYFLVALLCGILGFIITRKKPANTLFFAKEGFVTVSLSWIVLSLFGALPFVISSEIPSYLDALFEITSGFTTTGSSILKDVEAMSHCGLFWRSFSHWIGGMGVLVFILAVLPLTGGNNIYLVRAESPGPAVDKLVPRIRTSAMILYKIYIFLTVLLIIIFLIFKMPVFDAFCIAFGTAGTGGFAIKNSSLASYSAAIRNTTTIFMILFGINFNMYYLILCKRFHQAFKMEEVKAYLLIILGAIIIVVIDIRSYFPGFFETLSHAAFQVGSIITTTGYSSTDFNLWPNLSKTTLVILIFIGACAGSTGGGMKVSRVLILFKTIGKELFTVAHPRSVKKVKIDGHLIEHEVVRGVNVYMGSYIFIFALSVLLVSINEFDLVTTFTAVATTFNNVGPGLELVGPIGNFSQFSVFSKCVLIFDMLAGRLELFPVLLLFTPSTWKRI